MYLRGASNLKGAFAAQHAASMSGLSRHSMLDGSSRRLYKTLFHVPSNPVMPMPGLLPLSSYYGKLLYFCLLGCTRSLLVIQQEVNLP